jgi:molybdopterin molybdotransferase
MAGTTTDRVNPVAELFHVLPPAEAYEKFRKAFQPAIAIEDVALSEALGRTLATNVVAPGDLPAFPRSTVDGYALRATDSYGASDGQPAYLQLAGESLMGKTPTERVDLGTVVKIHTGAMVPDGADAIVMLEYTRDQGGGMIEVSRQVAPGENRIAAGEDVRQGEFLIGAGHLLRPQDIGGLAGIGVTTVPVVRRPRVAIISGGDEVVPPKVEPGPAQVRDINSFALEGLVREHGGEPVRLGIAADRFDVLRDLVQSALDTCDMVVVSGGSSVGTRDVTRAVIDAYGDPGVIVHGVALRPGKPTILAVVRGKPFFGLPGNPVSAICTFNLFVRPTILRALGQAEQPPPVTVAARLLRNVASVSGLEHYVQVRLDWQNGELCADPILGKSNLIFIVVKAHGFITVPLELSGIAAGELVKVQPYRLTLPPHT